MYGRAILMVLAAGACSHGEPARAAEIECRSTTPDIAGLSAGDACSLVRERTLAALAQSSRGRSAALTIELDLSRGGSAIARVRERRAGATHIYPEIAVDVMDRALGREDLIHLADAIAGAVSAGPQSN